MCVLLKKIGKNDKNDDKNEIKKQVIYYLYVCYWPGLLEDCSSRPGSVCGIVSRESIVGGTKGERKSESKLVVFVLNFTKEKKKGRGGIMNKKRIENKKNTPILLRLLLKSGVCLQSPYSLP